MATVAEVMETVRDLLRRAKALSVVDANPNSAPDQRLQALQALENQVVTLQQRFSCAITDSAELSVLLTEIDAVRQLASYSPKSDVPE